MFYIYFHIHFTFLLSQFIDTVHATLIDIIFVTFVDTLSVTFIDSLHKITEVSTVIFRYFSFLQKHVHCTKNKVFH